MGMTDILKKFHQRFSTYMAFGVWGVTGFIAQPTLGSLFVHLIVTPVMLTLTIVIAHREVK
jgi:hypothetical protein